jgi:hypothetical protein
MSVFVYVDGGGGIVVVMDDFHVALFWEGKKPCCTITYVYSNVGLIYETVCIYMLICIVGMVPERFYL